MNRRDWCAAAAAWATGLPGAVRANQAPAVLQSVGIFSLLGNSVRVIAREVDEVMFKDIAMDDVALGSVQAAMQSLQPQAQLGLYRSSEQVNVDDQVNLGAAAATRGSLPDWIARQAQTDGLTHALLITSSSGLLHFRTAMSQVVGNQRVTGVGFYVGADGRTTNLKTGDVSDGFLAPFVQLRLTLVDAAKRNAVNSVTFGEGYIVGPPAKEAPDPWRFMNRAEKAEALKGLLKTNLPRGVEAVLKPR